VAERTVDAARWITPARAGSREALGQMLTECQAYLLLIARQELDPALQAKGGASDLVQQTLLEACEDFAHFHGTTERELLAWLRRLLLNNLADLRRHYGQAKRQAACELTIRAEGSSAIGLDQFSSEESSPSAVAMAHEEAEAVERALERLPSHYRQVLLLRYRDQLPFEEIGRLIERSANAAEKLWLRAVERLREELRIAP
jgi:RNA polymerase sigma-70 factor (ECF subfamily)